MQELIRGMFAKLRGHVGTQSYEEVLFGLVAIPLLIGADACQHALETSKTKVELFSQLCNDKDEDTIGLLEFIFQDLLGSVADEQIIRNTLESVLMFDAGRLINEICFEGKENSNFSSTDSVNRLAIGLFGKRHYKHYLDLCVGVGGSIAQAYQSDVADSYLGIEISRFAAQVAKIKLRGLRAKHTRIVEGDVLRLADWLTSEHKYDAVFSHFPFLMKIPSEVQMEVSAQWKNYVFPMERRTTADWLYIGTMLNVLEEEGKAIAVMCNGPLFKITDIQVRKRLVEDGKLECIIQLPGGLLANTGIPISLLVFSSGNKKIKLIDASEVGTKKRGRTTLSQEDIEDIVGLYRDETDDENVKFVLPDTVESTGYRLDIAPYMEDVDVHTPFEVQFSSVIEKIFRGAQIPASKMDSIIVEQGGDGVSCYLLRIGDIQNGVIDIENMQKIDTAEVSQFARYVLEEGDIVLAAKGSNPKIAVASQMGDSKIIATGGLLVIRVNEKKARPFYLKTFFESESGQRILRSIQTGTVITSINPSQLKEVSISLPPMEIQQRAESIYLAKQDALRMTQKRLQELQFEADHVYDQIMEEIAHDE